MRVFNGYATNFNKGFYLLFKNIYFLIDFSYAIRIIILKVETIQLKQKHTHIKQYKRNTEYERTIR
ncbi:hypothetical protein EN12_21460 [Vibrio cholerae]|nr:hypothetical protein EN12_21460 [Vibrio cholerae]